jgi:hypothetical protein
MSHPDFRVGGRVFATLGYPDEDWGMVKLPPEQQDNFVKADPNVYRPAAGAWGRQGSTCVRLRGARTTSLRRAMHASWADAMAKSEKSNKRPRKARSSK